MSTTQIFNWVLAFHVITGSDLLWAPVPAIVPCRCTATLIFSSTEEALFLIGICLLGPWSGLSGYLYDRHAAYFALISFFTLAPQITFAWESSSYVRRWSIVLASWVHNLFRPVMWSRHPSGALCVTSRQRVVQGALTTSFALSCPLPHRQALLQVLRLHYSPDICVVKVYQWWLGDGFCNTFTVSDINWSITENAWSIGRFGT